jgi:NADH:ubiquinone oxidoreductase subunit 5 (subunit L)/multisubunit Na+/H+ antiporter MnhA subunit
MLMLVMANNFLQLYFGWEGVGLCSYFLIGYYFHKKSAADAGKKAFIVNRFGDFGFGIGVFMVFLTFGTLHYARIRERSGHSDKVNFLDGMSICPPHRTSALLRRCRKIGSDTSPCLAP